jgi:hypothetical protein
MPRDNEIVMFDQKNINFCIRLHFFLNFWSSEPWIPPDPHWPKRLETNADAEH